MVNSWTSQKVENKSILLIIPSFLIASNICLSLTLFGSLFLLHVHNIQMSRAGNELKSTKLTNLAHWLDIWHPQDRSRRRSSDILWNLMRKVCRSFRAAWTFNNHWKVCTSYWTSWKFNGFQESAWKSFAKCIWIEMAVLCNARAKLYRWKKCPILSSAWTSMHKCVPERRLRGILNYKWRGGPSLTSSSYSVFLEQKNIYEAI